MALSIVKLVDLKIKNWQSKTYSKLQNMKRQVLHQCLRVSRVCSTLRFRKKQERGGENPSCSATTFSVEIPEDLVEEILHRLPVESLLRFKSVSRGWKSMIESARLADKHLRVRQKKYGVEEVKVRFEWSESRGLHIEFFSKLNRFRGNSGEIFIPSLSQSSADPEVEAFIRGGGSCDGLVCLYDLTTIYIINPVTSVVRTLGPPHGTIFTVGFGRDVVTGTYKVAVVYHLDDRDLNKLEVMVFDLSTSEWRWRYKTAGPKPLSFAHITTERIPVFVNGSIFWLLTFGHPEILVMDLHTEKFSTLRLPDDLDESSGGVFIWSEELHLYICCVTYSVKKSGLWVLVQDEDGGRWERRRFDPAEDVFPPLHLNSAWLLKTLVSPYQSLSPDTYHF